MANFVPDPSGSSSGAPNNAQYVTLALSGALSGERVLTGTVNQITITDNGANGTVVLSLPQSIATSSTPQFARLGLGQAADAVANIAITQPAASSGSPSLELIVGGAHVTLAAGVEAIDLNWSGLSRTVQFTAGAMTLQRSAYLGAVTYSATSASTFTTIVGLEVEAPIAGTNVTGTSIFAGRFNGRLAINNTVNANQLTLQGGSGNVASIIVSASNTQLSILGGRSAASTGSDVIIGGQITRTAGDLAQFANNASIVAKVNFQGSFLGCFQTAIPAGGTVGVGIMLSTTANFGIFFGSGAPSLASAKGSLYLRSDGGAINTRLYVNTDGSTAWTNFASAA